MTAAPGEKSIVVTRSEAQPSRQGPAESFTGSVRVDQQFHAAAPGRVLGARVTFEPGARTAWHSHPLGQTLIVMSGVGRVQRWGDPVDEIRPGDLVWIPAGQKHWHGASPTTAMTHIAIVETLDGRSSDWMEKVPDEQYAAPVHPRAAAATPPAAPEHGRRRDGTPKFSARTIDLDALLYGEEIHHEGGIDVPRGEIRQHAFVLAPLAELIPDLRHPETGETYRALWNGFTDKRAILRTVPLPLDQ